MKKNFFFFLVLTEQEGERGWTEYWIQEITLMEREVPPRRKRGIVNFLKGFNSIVV